MNSTLYSRLTSARRIAAACGVGVLLVGATACGSKGNDNPTTNATSGAQTTQSNGNAGQFPGANGKIAAVDGSTAQVQSQQDGQVAVTWTSSTTFTQQVAASLADVKVGDCVMATPAQTTSSSSSDDSTVAAATVRIISTSGDCTSGFGGPGGGQRPSFNGTPPSGAPTGAPTGAPGGGQFRGSFGAAGKVTAVTGSGFTVASTRPDFNASGSSPSSSATPTTSSVTVTTSSTTTYTTNAKASASDVKVGRCMTAQGATDDTGAVTARTVALSAAVDGECTGGFARFRSGGTGSGTTGEAS